MLGCDENDFKKKIEEVLKKLEFSIGKNEISYFTNYFYASYWFFARRNRMSRGSFGLNKATNERFLYCSTISKLELNNTDIIVHDV